MAFGPLVACSNSKVNEEESTNKTSRTSSSDEDDSKERIESSTDYVEVSEIDESVIDETEYIETPDITASDYYDLTISMNTDLFDELYGYDVSESLNRFVLAVLNREETFTYELEEQQFFWDIWININLFPLLDVIVSDFYYDNSTRTISFNYVFSEDEQDEIIVEFINRVYEIFSSADIEDNDSETVKALILHHYISMNSTYDDEAVNTGNYANITTYRMIMEGIGICQSFAGAYSYLAMVCGLPATCCSGITDNGAGHEWSYVKIDGSYYHVDPTFENGYGGCGLVFFGMTNEYRAEMGFPIEDFNISNQWHSYDVVADNARFMDLWDFEYVYNIERTDEGLHITGVSLETGEDIEYYLT